MLSRPPAESTHKVYIIFVIGSGTTDQESMLKRLGYWARQLKYGQFRLLLALAELTEDDEHHSVKIALRELCKLANIAASVFPDALKALEERNLITVRHGGNRRQNAYQVNFFKLICASNFDAQGPLRASKSDAQLHLNSMHSASKFDAPPIEKEALARAAAASDFDSSILILIDHVCSAKAKNFDAETLTRFRRWLHSYMAKCGRKVTGERWADLTESPPPPSNDQVAQFLSVSDERTLTRMLDDLLRENHDVYGYQWFWAVALQRIHGVSVEKRKKATAILVDVKRQAEQQRVIRQLSSRLRKQLGTLCNSAANPKWPRWAFPHRNYRRARPARPGPSHSLFLQRPAGGSR